MVYEGVLLRAVTELQARRWLELVHMLDILGVGGEMASSTPCDQTLSSQSSKTFCVYTIQLRNREFSSREYCSIGL